MPNHVELEEWASPEHVEAAYREACIQMERRNQRWAEIGWKAAQRRDDKLLKALERAAEVTDRMDETQYGRTRRAAQTLAQSVQTTESQLFRVSYETCLKGTPVENLKWIYGAAAWMCGYNT